MFKRVKAWLYVMFNSPFGSFERCKICDPFCPYVLDCYADLEIEKTFDCRKGD